MDDQQKIFALVKKHLEFKDNWGNNPYLPKDKTDAFLKELQAFIVEIYNTGKQEGQSEMVVAFKELFDNAVKEKQEELKLNEDRKDTIQSYFNWHRKFFGGK